MEIQQKVSAPMNSTAFLTTVYPGSENFIKEMLVSLAAQTCNAFDLVILNDGVENLAEFVDAYAPIIQVIELYVDKSPVKNREYGINYCIKLGYQKLIFGDADDWFSDNRVECSINCLEKFDIVVNDLALVTEEGEIRNFYFSSRLGNYSLVDYKLIKNKNIFGLTNTGIRLDNMNPVFFPDEVIAVDWYFFATMLLKRKKAVFTSDTQTYYRQHAGNLIGLGNRSTENLAFVHDVRRAHKKLMKAFLRQHQDFKMFDLDNPPDEISRPSSDCRVWWEI